MVHKLKTQGGFAHVMLIAVVVVLAGVGGIGYYVFSKNKDASGTSGGTLQNAVSDKAVADACNKELNDKDFCKFASNWKGLETYKTTIVSTGSDGTSTMTLAAEGTDKTSMTISQGGKEVSAYISIGKTTYTKDEADGSWTQFTDDSKTSASTSVKDDIKVDDFSTPNARQDSRAPYIKIGKEACGSLNCLKYQIVNTGKPASEQFLWFDTKDYLMRRWTNKDADGTSDMTISYDKVNIKAPSPIKTSTTSSASEAEMQKQIEDAMKAAGVSDTSEQ